MISGTFLVEFKEGNLGVFDGNFRKLGRWTGKGLVGEEREILVRGWMNEVLEE